MKSRRRGTKRGSGAAGLVASIRFIKRLETAEARIRIARDTRLTVTPLAEDSPPAAVPNSEEIALAFVERRTLQ